MTKGNCGSCKFFAKSIDPKNIKGAQGVCHRFPPKTSAVAIPQGAGLDGSMQIGIHQYAAMPVVSETEWCGEFAVDMWR